MRRLDLPWCVLWVLLAWPLIGCSSPDDGFSTGDDDTTIDDDDDDDDSAADDDTADDDDSAGDDDDSAADVWYSCDDPSSPYCVIETEDLGLVAPYNAWDDYEEYFLLQAEPFAFEVDVDAEFQAIHDGLIDVLGEWPAGDPRDTLLDELNMRFLLEGHGSPGDTTYFRDMNTRPLFVTLGTEREEELETGGSVRIQEWSFSDSLIDDLEEATGTFTIVDGGFVGSFWAIAYFPLHCEDEPLPAVITEHGHFQGYMDPIDGQPGLRHLISDCFVAAAPEIRASDTLEETEQYITRTMLSQGFNMQETRIYESLLVRKWLNSRADVDATRIGLLGHSGGSVSSTLISRVETFPAAIIDLTGLFFVAEPTGDGSFTYVTDENCPALYPYHELIGDLSTSPSPSYLFEYGYGGDYGEEGSSADTIHHIFQHRLGGAAMDPDLLAADPNLLWAPELAQ